MPDNYTPLGSGQLPATSGTFNPIFEELDDAIGPLSGLTVVGDDSSAAAAIEELGTGTRKTAFAVNTGRSETTSTLRLYYGADAVDVAYNGEHVLVSTPIAPTVLDLPVRTDDPASPPSGYLSLYAKTVDGTARLYIKTSTGTVTEVGSGGAANLSPTANAGADDSIDLPTEQYTFDGTGSSDSDGTIAAYLWEVLSKPSAATVTWDDETISGPTLSGMDTAGVYQIQLTVTDDDGATDTDTVDITVNAAGGPTGLQANVTAFWELNEDGSSSDVTREDDGPDGRDLTADTGKYPDDTTGIGGGGDLAADFDSANGEFLTNANSMGLTADHTMCMFVKITAAPGATARVVYGGGPTGVGGSAVSINTSRLAYLTYYSGSSNDSTAAMQFGTLSTDTWYFIAFSVNLDGTTSVVINGYIAAAGAGSVTKKTTVNWTAAAVPANPMSAIWLACDSSKNGDWDGALQKLIIFDKVLSDAEIDDVWNGGAGVSYADLASL